MEAIVIRICINEDLKVIQFWLTREERDSVENLNLIKNYSDEYTINKNFRKVIYMVGNKDVVGLTSSLLKQNARL